MIDKTEAALSALLNKIEPLDRDAMDAAEKRQSELAKPPGSFGKLEELSIRLAGITGKVNNHMDKRVLLVFAADNGVFEEGVSSCPQSVTMQQTINLTRGKTGAATLCAHYGIDLHVCDVGVNEDILDPKVINRKIAYGTGNITKGPAMTREQCVNAMMTGVEMVDTYCSDADVVGVGEMGICNTTTSAAVLASLLDLPAECVTGKGSGADMTTFLRKKECVTRAIEINKPDANDAIDVVAKVGGFDIAAMAGAYIASAARRIPAVIDGYIGVVAALVATRICPAVRDYLVPSHASYEVGYRYAIDALELEPMLLLGMRLGEGSGCPIAMHILDCACTIINEMSDFASCEIDDGYLDDLRVGNSFDKEKFTVGE